MKISKYTKLCEPHHSNFNIEKFIKTFNLNKKNITPINRDRISLKVQEQNVFFSFLHTCTKFQQPKRNTKCYRN